VKCRNCNKKRTNDSPYCEDCKKVYEIISESQEGVLGLSEVTGSND